MTSAQLNALEMQKPSALVQPAKNCAFYEAKLSQCESDYDMWLDEFKKSGSWREKYKSWESCCEVLLGKSQQAIDKRIKKYRETTEVVSEPDKTEQQEQKALSQVESAREEEPEKPRVKTALESIADNAQKNGHVEPPKAKAQPTENGRPKYCLAVWKTLEERFLGPLIREVDSLHHQCPNKSMHDRLVAQIGMCFDTLKLWRESVK